MSTNDSIGSPGAAELNIEIAPPESIRPLPKIDSRDLEMGQPSSNHGVIVEVMTVEEGTNRQPHRKRRCFILGARQNRHCILVSIAAVEVVLGPVIYLAGMIAEHSLDWKPLFMALFAGWTVLLAIGLCVDMYSLRNIDLIKRAFWHLGSCILMRYIASTTQATADALPRDLPLIINCGLGVSLGIQKLPTTIRRDLWRGLNEVAGSFCGGVQVRFQGGSSAAGRPRISSDGE
ncbi:uncharacterized protein PAC_02476 [Phialocephala subalpina]|uniref:Uncharacterized protein n=1 Tax=Phialocephala subalpina TaxID=576137 RepID=A0A1L7WIK7_9HELO|nr:uncharacterized protein PAC_02476 [Phialocephala subalpina]